MSVGRLNRRAGVAFSELFPSLNNKSLYIDLIMADLRPYTCCVAG
jgi:hypothetical protein